MHNNHNLECFYWEIDKKFDNVFRDMYFKKNLDSHSVLIIFSKLLDAESFNFGTEGILIGQLHCILHFKMDTQTLTNTFTLFSVVNQAESKLFFAENENPCLLS